MRYNYDELPMTTPNEETHNATREEKKYIHSFHVLLEINTVRFMMRKFFVLSCV